MKKTPCLIDRFSATARGLTRWVHTTPGATLVALMMILPAYGEEDSDGDGLTDDVDPAPYDSTNYSDLNGVTWYGEALNDADSDGQVNFWDPDPYNPPIPDSDNDGYPDDIDPAPIDPTNYSGINLTSWYSYALSDNDGDGQVNFSDSDPNNPPPPPPGDTDGDGLTDDIDPASSDPTNYSSINQIFWGGAALGDNDGDGTLNFWDSAPNGGYPDADNDGFGSDIDPNDNDNTNHSPSNGLTWFGYVFNDNDNDGILNYWDSTPNTNDSDGDGFTWDIDPNDNDSSNYSSANGTAWYGSVFGDQDGDGELNFWDSHPNGNPPGPDTDGDGIPDSSDPAPSDAYNYSPHNGMTWTSNGPGVFGDADQDGTSNWWDPSPGVVPDSDGDGLTDDIDPAPNDSNNWSSVNYLNWPGMTALDDDDGDSVQNWWDTSPYPAN